MENHPHEAIDTVLNCVIPYIQNGDDRNSVSSVCRKLCEFEGMTRKHVTVHMFYSPTPSRLHQRFPSIESLTLEGLPYWLQKKLSVDINPWIQEIAVSFRRLKSLHMRCMDVHDSDLELLATTRGRDLWVLKIYKCKGFSTDGLLHIDGKWLHELALQNTGIESFDFRYFVHAKKDLTLLAKNCSQSLVSLKIDGILDPVNLVDVFRYSVKLEDFVGDHWVEDQVYAGFKFPTSMRCMSIYCLTESSLPFVLSFAHQLRKLHLNFTYLDANSQFLLFQSCPNLEVFYSFTVKMELPVIGQFCKKLRKFKTDKLVTQMGLITMAKGCPELECLHIQLTNISNEILECIGTHLKNLRDFHMTLSYKYGNTSGTLEDGILAMLIGCSKLERLSIRLRPLHGGLTDECLRYIGKYGHNLRYLYLGYVGESIAGLAELSVGCPKLRKLEMMVCPFSEEEIAKLVFNIHSLRYVWIRDTSDFTTLTLTRPNS